MKFLCGSCRTKYQISDEKVRGKILTIRCKKCGAKILVRESLSKNMGGGTAVAPVAEEERPKAEVSAKHSVGGSARTGGSAALASAFEVAMHGGAAEADDMPTSIAPVPANLDNAGVEWYVAIDGEQFGPYAFADLVRRVVNREVIGRHYAWHDGMDNWTRVRDVKDLAPYLPGDKKRPPPPPPPTSGEHAAPGLDDDDETVAAGPGAEIVDLSVRRAERERKQSPEAATTTDSARAPGSDTAAERAEQLDSVLNEALGIAGEGKTTKADTDAAVAVTGTAKAKGKTEPSIDDLLAFESRDDDIFANVPRASDEENVQRESTRFFVAAAGVNARKSKNKVAMVLGGVMAMGFIAFLGSWAVGIIKIEIPGIGNPFANVGGGSLFASNDEPEVDEKDVEEAKKLGREERRRRRRRRAKQRPSRPTGYVRDDGETGSRGPRGDGAEALDIDLGTEPAVGIAGESDVKLPQADLNDVPLPDSGTLSQKAITQVINAKRNSVKFCYQIALKGQENLRGKLEIRVTIEPSGRVSKASVETSVFRGSKLGRCIAEKIEDWRFPSFSGGSQQVLVPFLLEKGSY